MYHTKGSHPFIVIMLLGIYFFTAGCGSDAKFRGLNPMKPRKGKAPPQSGTSDDLIRATSLTWLWPCEGRNIQPPVDENEQVITGPGPHMLDYARFEGAQMTVTGATCGARDVRRDVVFVIDVSGSMAEKGLFLPKPTDPMVNGTCGRMKALNEVIDSMVGQKARFGIVTFHSRVRNQSSQMFLDKLALYEDLVAHSSFSSIEELICSGSGATNYEAGLEGAQELLRVENSQQKEIYFVSDGQPDPSDKHGKKIAQSLKDEGVSIATVMVNAQDDSVLKEFIASKDFLGAPLHARVDQADQLAAALSKFAQNDVIAGELRVFNAGQKDDDQGEVKKLDFTDKLKGSIFSFESVVIKTPLKDEALEIEILYHDKFGQTETHTGRIVWQ